MLYHRGTPFERTFDSIIYSTEDSYEKKTTIHIEGERYKRLSGKHRIVGNVTVDQDLTYRIAADFNGRGYVHHIVRWGEDNVQQTAGSIHISKDFSTVWIKSDDFDTRYSIIEGYAFGPTEAWKGFEGTITIN